MLRKMKPAILCSFLTSTIVIDYSDWIEPLSDESISIKKIIRKVVFKEYDDIYKSITQLEKYQFEKVIDYLLNLDQS